MGISMQTQAKENSLTWENTVLFNFFFFFFSSPSFSQAAIGRVVQISELFNFSFLHGWWCRKGAWVTCKVEKPQSALVSSPDLIYLFSIWTYLQKEIAHLYRKISWMLYLNVKLTCSIKDCMASILLLFQCWGSTGSFSTWGTLSAWAWMFSKKKVRWSHPPSQNLPVKGFGGSGGRHGQVQKLFSLWVTPGPCGGCVPWRSSLLERKKGFYLTIYRRSFRNIKYLSAKWGKSKEGLKSCRKKHLGITTTWKIVCKCIGQSSLPV